jgi:hypothetical protein
MTSGLCGRTLSGASAAPYVYILAARDQTLFGDPLERRPSSAAQEAKQPK